MSDINPSSCSIEKAFIETYDGESNADIKKMITGFELEQGMNMSSYKGVIDVMDNIGVLEKTPLRGEESLELWITAHDGSGSIKLNNRIFKIDSIQPSDVGKGLIYKIHFISEDSFNAGKKIITQSNYKPVYEIVKQIFNSSFCRILGEGSDFYTDQEEEKLPFRSKRWALEKLNGLHKRDVIIQQTDKPHNIIIPRLSSQEAMYFLASRSYSAETPSQSFKFFETFERYYFCTDEYFVKFHNNNPKNIFKLHYSPISELQSGSIDPVQQMSKIDNLFVDNKGIDSASDMASGAYKNKVIEIDFVRKKVTSNIFNYDNASYIDMSGDIKNIDNNPHSATFREDTFTDNNAPQFLIFKNYSTNGDNISNLPGDRMLTNILQNRISYYHHLNNTAIIAQLKGRIDLRPGMIIDLSIPSFDGDGTKRNAQLAGRYMIQSIKHQMKKDNTLSTGIRMIKFDWSGNNE